LSILEAIRHRAAVPITGPEDAIRAELFSIERLEQHAESLAAAQRVAPRPVAGRPLATRLRENGRVLLAAYRAIVSATRDNYPITPAAEWLIDNFHIVQDQIREIRRDLPPRFYRELPKLAEGPLAGYPRVFGLAWAFVAHTDSRFDEQMLCRFVAAYQRVQPLLIGELWAIAITLRIVLVENLRRSAQRIVAGREARQAADLSIDRLLGMDGGEAETATAVFGNLGSMPLPAAFAAQLVQRLRDQDPKTTPALLWLDQRLAAQGTTADEIVREEHQSQGASNITVRNIITSMRLISAVNWATLFEKISLVDAALRAGSGYGEMDFRTRDLYRRAIEELSRYSTHTELEVTELALAAAGAEGQRGVEADEDAVAAARQRDPGYHLIGKGRRGFEKQLGFRIPPRQWLTRANAAVGISGYLAAIAVVTAIIVALALLWCAEGGGGWLLWLLGVLAVIPASDAAVSLVNRAATKRFGATILPGLALRGGVPEGLRTMIVVPTFLTGRAAIEEQIERLEVHCLANDVGDLSFALLSDWTDCETETAPGDEELLAIAVEGIARLNHRHEAGPEGERFLLLHRRRVWNAGEGKWIGWERKRGKLHELNRLLRGATDTSFLPLAGRAPAVPSGVRYVITLDADTRLPRGSVKRLVGKMAHPLNRPELDPVSGRVVAGYGVLQPRVTPSLPTGREGSRFQRIFSSTSGMDPYAFAVSDVYQDLFGEGSFSGKGIYDVDAFEAALQGRIPENAVLSHDLLEGIFARAGLVTDIELVEEHPSRYNVSAARQHRWARGDWQLLPWILGLRRSSGNDRPRAEIPLIGRWKMVDNLRRTLSAPAASLALLAGWLLPFVDTKLWTALVLVSIAMPALLPFLSGILPRRLGISKRTHASSLAADFELAFGQTALLTTLLADQAWLMADAIGRTLYRLFLSHRKLLEWVTAAQVQIGAELDLAGFYRQMAGGCVLAVVAGSLVAWLQPGSLPLAAPFLALWLLSPVIARWVSQPPPEAIHRPVSFADARTLRLVARRTWHFFESFVTAEDNMLPPDNFQEDPKPTVAHRTSPTNFGMYLLSVVAARDFAWLGHLDAADRLEATFATMGKLQRFRGHFFNWYDTRDLRPLEPKYVSSVDSGNLAGHLIALANACREPIDPAIANGHWIAGVEDALALARDALPPGPAQASVRKQLEAAFTVMDGALAAAAEPAGDLARQLATLALQADGAIELAKKLAGEGSAGTLDDTLIWLRALRESIGSHQRDLDELMPAAAPLAEDVAAARRAAEGPEAPEVTEDLPAGRQALQRRLLALAELASTVSAEMEFGFLLDPVRQLLSIGFQVGEGSLDPSCYDLLASEARLASFVAIAKGDVPTRHWFRLGRAVTPVDRGSALISWSGSMFEYLMPSLVMRAPTGSLIEETTRLVVRRQISYGAERGVPWGVSESAFNARDLEFTYQYSNFGVPGLGLKRGLGQDVVVAPYATGLAAMVDPAAAARNYGRLMSVGGRGRYGWYEALDYTPSRVPEGEEVAIVRAYMAHHQGMTVVAIANALQDGIMRTRFHAEPMVQATELLLQERPSRDIVVARPRADEVKAAARVRELIPPMLRRFRSPHGAVPRTHLLSNGRYSVMVTNAGAGYSRWRDLAVTRWREDATRDPWGSFVFLRDTGSGEVWSAGYQPSGREATSYDVTFSEDRVEFVRRDGTLTTTTVIAVSPEDDAEVRRISIANQGHFPREIELTSYAELVLAPQASDVAHPAFSKLFVQTEFVAEAGTLLATRRRRSPEETEVWAAHLAVVEGETVGEMQFETDRARFIGRGHELRSSQFMNAGRALSNTTGTVLDPVFSLRHRVLVPSGTTVRVAYWTVVAPTRQEALDLADRHHQPTAYDRAVTLAWTQAQVQLRHLGISADEAHVFQRIANRVLYADPTLRPSSDALQRNHFGPSILWPHGISGDLPIVLVRIDEVADMEIVRQLFRAHEYWRMKRLAVDLVILNERPPSYAQDLQSGIEAAARMSQTRTGEGPGGKVFILRSDLVSVDARTALQSVARAVLLSRRGSVAEQVKRLREVAPNTVPPARRPASYRVAEATPRPPELAHFNGLGGFSPDGREYVTILGRGQTTPAPWINVIANPSFGFEVSAEGGCYSWSVNSRENQLTPWSNDPVIDPPGEAIYLRDEENGDVWSPTALPIREETSPYIVRHGQGYSRFEHAAHGISLELLQYVPLKDPIKISRLTIRNESKRHRRLSVTGYVEWVLGTSRGASGPNVVTEIDPESGAMLALNAWRPEFGSRIAFADLGGRQQRWTGDRTEFLGRNGGLDFPAALAGDTALSNRTGAGMDPCAVLQTQFDLAPNASTEVVFILGEAATRVEAIALVMRYRSADLDAVLKEVEQEWDDILCTVQVKTPDASMDVMLNRWLLYQALGCRIVARSAFYQAGGAYGFRDQLQDGMAMAVSRPALVREHLLRAAGRQFVDGDYQHWWLPHNGQGVRTRISDDRVWLPYAVAHYIEVTGDLGVLDETMPFLEGPALRPGETESFFQPMVADEKATLFEHCALGLDRSLVNGVHGLPLMGTGDWNDGMNRVGIEGKGESVWLAWFLYATLQAFAPLAEARGEQVRAATWRRHAEALRDSVEREAWDGEWYRRGYFDDGTPLGSASNSECRIDSIAQSWGVISGAAEPERARRAMASAERQLIDRKNGLMMLFTPPFDKTLLDPGYIKGYPTGIRENGGQYTHAALWSILAYAMQGEGDKAAELFAMLNPVNRADTPADTERYKVEPYVVTADIYSSPLHLGRGGWTWYTGSSGWMYRVGLERILGFRVQGKVLVLDPCIPKAWPRFEITYRHGASRYEIAVGNPHGVNRGVAKLEMDGKVLPQGPAQIPLVDDGATHRVQVTLGSERPAVEGRSGAEASTRVSEGAAAPATSDSAPPR
jgi:cyclic beta-1,2-glucan synthetase